MNWDKKTKDICISSEKNVLEAIRQMDLTESKLLLVIDGEKLQGLVSIGDIQRSLIKKQNFKELIKNILRKEFTVGRNTQSQQEIKALMIKHRTEFMPILSAEGELSKIVFWEDVFEENRTLNRKIEIPVVIMAGGKGTRLRPITNIIPKPLIPIGEQTIAELIINSFKNLGSKNFYLSVNYKADMIEGYFKEKNNLNVNISYFIEDKPLGTAGSLHLLDGKINSTFFVSNCDIIIDQDYYEILNYHQKNKNEITLVAAIKNFRIPYGTIEVENNGIVKSMQEKPNFTFYVNAGLYILEPHLLHEIPKNEFFHITHLIDKVNKRNGRVGMFPISEGAWSDIGEWDKYKLTLAKFGYKAW